MNTLKKLLSYIIKIICWFVGFFLILFGGCILSVLLKESDMLLLSLIMGIPVMALGIYILFYPKKLQKKNSKKNLPAKETAFIFDENSKFVGKVDGTELSDEDIPELINITYEHQTEYKQNSSNPKFHRTEHEEDLDAAFFSKYQNKLFAYEEAFQNEYAIAREETDQRLRYKHLQLTKQLYEKTKSFCYSHGKGGRIYFDDTWEHLHNSKNECFSWIEKIDRELESINLVCLENEFIDINNEKRIFDDCISIINTTTNPDTFFLRYDLLLEKTTILVDAGEIQQAELNLFKDNYDVLVKDFIDRYWLKVFTHIKELKTEKAKANNYNKFITALDNYSDRISENNKQYYRSFSY